MNLLKAMSRAVSLLLSLLLIAVQPAATAGRSLTLRRSAAAPTLPSTEGVNQSQDQDDSAGVTFDNLLPANTYSVYVEVRNLGSQVGPGGLSEVFYPLLSQIAPLSKPVSSLGRFLAEQSKILAQSRMMLAFSTTRTGLPQSVMAVEMASPSDAEEFEPKFRGFLGSFLPPNGASAASASNVASASAANSQPGAQSTQAGFFLKRLRRILLVSDAACTPKTLRPGGAAALEDDTNFRTARDHFAFESLFVYINSALDSHVHGPEASGDSAEIDVSPPGAPIVDPDLEKAGDPPAPARTTKTRAAAADQAPGESSASPNTSAAAAPGGRVAGSAPRTNRAAPPRRATPPPPPEPPMGGSRFSDTIFQMLFAGGGSMAVSPEGIAVALTVDGDSFVVRCLLLNAPEAPPGGPIPLLPSLISGPAIGSDAAAYLPGDTDVFVTASVDLRQMYDAVLANMKKQSAQYEPLPTRGRAPTGAQSVEERIAAFEKANGFTIKDGVLGALGDEIAVSLPAHALGQMFGGGAPASFAKLGAGASKQTAPVFLVAVRNREALQRNLLPALEALGLKAAKEKGVSEKHGDFEIASYANVSVAFLNSYLILGPDAAAVSHVIDKYLKAETLAASADFHGYMQWQPRTALARLYISSGVIKVMLSEILGEGRMPAPLEDDDETRALLAQLNYPGEPVTFATMADPAGPVYELRLPKRVITTLGAGISLQEKQTRLPRNESMARMLLGAFADAEKAYRTDHARYGSLEEIQTALPFDKNLLENYGYKFEFSVADGKYEGTATPLEYGKSGRLSFFIDESGLREGDHGGRPGTAADKKAPGQPE